MVSYVATMASPLKDETHAYESRGEHMTFRRDEHPFKQWSRYCNPVDKSQLIEVFFAREWFAMAAVKFVHFAPDCADVARKVLDLLYLYCYIVERARSEINKDNEDKAQPSKPRRSDSRASNASGDEVADAAAQERKAAEDAARKDKEDEDKRRGIISLMEVVPSGKDPSKVVGYRKKLIINTDRVNPALILSALFNSNAKKARQANVVHNPFQKKGEKKQRIHTITFADYVSLCEWYTGKCFPAHQALHPDDINKGDNGLNPLAVFSLSNSLRLAKGFDAHPMYTTPSRYVYGPVYGSPEGGKHMYWLRLPEYDALDKVLLYMWPNIQKTSDYDRQKELYMRTASSDLGDSDCDDDDDDVPLHERLSEVYDRTCRNATALSNINNLRALGARQAEKRHTLQLELETISDGEERDKRLVSGMQQIASSGLEEFKQIFSTSGTIPKSLRAIALYIERNFYNGAKKKWRKQIGDMSRFGELMVSMTASSEALLKINTLQADQIGCFLKVIHVYSGKTFHTHTLWTGPAKAGKSHIQRTVSSLLIAGTCQEFAYASAKADAAPGDDRDYSIYFYEEIPASMLGANKAGGGGKAAATAMTDQESFIKNVLTSGRFNVKRQEKDENGRFVSVDVDVFCNSVWLAATNEPLGNIPDAMTSRFHVRNLQTTTRLDAGGLLGKTQDNTDIHFLRARSELQDRYRRMQALAAVAFQMIYTGVLPRIEMSAANIVLIEVMRQARAIGLPDTDDVRHYERVTFIIEACVVLEAIDTVFDSEVSPVADGDKFDYEQMLQLAPYLRATIEHCVFALGLLRDQYENPVQRNVVTSLCETFFQVGLNREALMDAEGIEEAPLVDEQQESFDDRQSRLNVLDDNYYICEYPAGGTIPATPASSPIDTSSVIQPVGYGGKPPRHPAAGAAAQQQQQWKPRAPRQHELDDRSLIRQLTQELYNKMHPRPQIEEIRTVLEKMTTQLIPDKHRESHGIPALYFRDGRMYVSRSMYRQLQSHDLRSVVKSVVGKCITTPQTMVYGGTLPDKPYALDTLYVEPNPDESQRLVVEDPNYFDEAVSKLSLNLCPSFNEDTDKSRKMVFSPIPGYIINCSIDWHACQRHLQANGITAESLENMPSPLPTKLLQQVLRKCTSDLQNYHDWIRLSKKNFKKRVLEMGDSCELNNVTMKRTRSNMFALEPDGPPQRLTVDTRSSSSGALQHNNVEAPMSSSFMRIQQIMGRSALLFGEDGIVA